MPKEIHSTHTGTNLNCNFKRKLISKLNWQRIYNTFTKHKATKKMFSVHVKYWGSNKLKQKQAICEKQCKTKTKKNT